jgi:hypothetical protein
MQRQLAVDAADEGLLPWTSKLTRMTSLPWPASMVVGPGVLDIDDVVGAVDDGLLVTQVDEGHAGMGGGDVKVVVAVAQPDLEHVESGVADAQRHSHADDLAGEAAVLAGGVAAVVELQRIGAAGAAIDLQPAGKAVDAGVEGIEQAVIWPTSPVVEPTRTMSLPPPVESVRSPTSVSMLKTSAPARC